MKKSARPRQDAVPGIHTFDFERPNRSCQHIYIDFHICSQKTTFWPTLPVLSTYLHRFPQMLSEHYVRMVYLQINRQFQTHIFDFGRPNQYCQHIYINFHTCSQKTRSGWFIYKLTDSFELTYSILADPTGTVNISTSISTSFLRSLGQDGLSTNQQCVWNTYIVF
jgi:hypothetical protein